MATHVHVHLSGAKTKDAAGKSVNYRGCQIKEMVAVSGEGTGEFNVWNGSHLRRGGFASLEDAKRYVDQIIADWDAKHGPKTKDAGLRITLREMDDGSLIGTYSSVEAAWRAVKTDFGPLSRKPRNLDAFKAACIDSGVVSIEVVGGTKDAAPDAIRKEITAQERLIEAAKKSGKPVPLALVQRLEMLKDRLAKAEAGTKDAVIKQPMPSDYRILIREMPGGDEFILQSRIGNSWSSGQWPSIEKINAQLKVRGVDPAKVQTIKQKFNSGTSRFNKTEDVMNDMVTGGGTKDAASDYEPEAERQPVPVGGKQWRAGIFQKGRGRVWTSRELYASEQEAKAAAVAQIKKAHA